MSPIFMRFNVSKRREYGEDKTKRGILHIVWNELLTIFFTYFQRIIMFCPFLVNTPGISCTETENRPVQYHSFYHHSKLKNKTYLTKIMPQCPKYLCINGPDTPQSPISVHECYAYQQSYLLGCSIAQHFVEKTPLLAKTFCHP